MTITKDVIKVYIEGRRNDGANNQEIEDDFKNALRCKLINVDYYYEAMKIIYK